MVRNMALWGSCGRSGIRATVRFMSRATGAGGKMAVTSPGQGIIRNGFLDPFKAHRKHYAGLLEELDDSLQERFSERLMEPGGGTNATEWLLRTSNAQPAILATTIILHHIMKKEFGLDLVSQADYLLGHSLGEYTSLALAGVISFADAVKLVRFRGRRFEETVQTQDFGMVALSIRPQSFGEVLSRAGDAVSNINSYSQIVLSGKLSDLQSTIDAINTPKRLVLRASTLPVRIPFHSATLRPVEAELMPYISNPGTPRTPMVSNLTGSLSLDCYRDTIRCNSRPVQWVKSMEHLIDQGVTRVVNVGPGTVLQSINSRFDVENVSLDTLEAMEEYAKHC